MSEKIAVVGAGIIGRLLAIKLSESGYDVSIYEKGDWLNSDSCSYTAAGMIAPYCELETAEYLVARIGLEPFYLWPEIINSLDEEIFFQKNGSLVIAPQNYTEELTHLKQ